MLRLGILGYYPIDSRSIAAGPDYTLYVLANTLTERGDVIITVVSPTRGRSGVTVVDEGKLRVLRVGVPAIPGIPSLFRQPICVARVLRRLELDVVNSHNVITTSAALKAGLRVVHTIHGIKHLESRLFTPREKISALAASAVERRCIARSHSIIAVARYGLACFADVIRSPARVINNPVEDIFFQVAAPRAPQSVLYVGMVGRRKNLKCLIAAMAEVTRQRPGTSLRICGKILEQDYYQEVLAQIDRLGLTKHVSFLGVVDRSTMAALLEDSACLALPSKQETLPISIAQAMAAARPVVASPVGGIPEMIEEAVTGFLVDPDDAESLAERIGRLLDAPRLVEAMGQAARSTAVARYERHRVANAFLAVCREVAELPNDADA